MPNPAASSSSSATNFNVGILGHVDSGKTSLAKALSSVSSTAAFDKNPQSQERGITLDLGFSSFAAGGIQYTLVDCPGHASLIRTIIGGAQIIDLMILVIDVTKGVQTQTAECLVIGEITCPDNMVVVLNKVDLVEEGKREAVVEKMKKKLKITLSKTAFKNAPMVAVAANVEQGGGSIGLDILVDQLKSMTKVPVRNSGGSFLFSVDHCFSIRGQGTIMTGTVLQGSISVNENVEIVNLRETRKVKSIQMFKQPVQSAIQGDRIGLCVTQFDAKLLERGLVSSPGQVPTLYGGVVRLRKIPYFKGEIATKSKFHISLGHETVLGRLTLFTPTKDKDEDDEFRIDSEYRYVERLSDETEKEKEEEGSGRESVVFAIIEFERPVPVVPNCKVLGSRLDADTHTTSCRMAFHGLLSYSFTDKSYSENELPLFKIFNVKKKEGLVERANNECEVICKSMFKKETNLALFSGLEVTLSTGEKGRIAEPFGQSGKFKVRIPEGLQASTMALLGNKKKKSTTEGGGDVIKLHLSFKRYIFSKKMVQ